MIVPFGNLEKTEDSWFWVIDLGKGQHVYDIKARIPIGEDLEVLPDIVSIVVHNLTLQV